MHLTSSESSVSPSPSLFRESIKPAELARTLFEESGDALFLFDPDTENLIDINPLAQRFCGLSRKEILKYPVSYFFRSEVPGGLNRLRHAYCKTGAFHSQEGFFLRHSAEGSWIPVNLTVARLHAHPRILGLITARDLREQRQAHATRMQLEGELRQMMTLVPNCIWSLRVDSESRFVYRYISPGIEKITGYPPDHFLKGPEVWLSLIHPEDRPARQAFIETLPGTAVGRYEFEYRILGAHQAQRWVQDSLVITLDPPGEGRRIDGVITDITERKVSEALLRESEGHYRFLFAHNPHPMFIYDAETLAYLDVNEAAVGAYGFSREEFLGMTVDDIGPAEITAGESSSPRAPIPSGVCRHRKKTGEIFHVDIVSSNLTYEGRPARLIVVYDISQRLQIEEALRSSEARYRSLVENLEQNILLKDANHRYVAANRRYCEGIGQTETAIIGKTDFDIYPPELANKYFADDKRVLDDGERLEMEETNLANGQYRTVRVIKTPVRDANNAVTGVLIIFWDVTRQRDLEAQLRQSQKMEAVGLLAGGVAHDFNNLLTAILGNLNLAQMHLPADHGSRRLLAAAEKASRRAADLTSQLLGFSRRTLLRPQPTNLNDTMEEVVGLLSRIIDPRITLLSDKETTPWTVLADPGQVTQVLMNLCLNARDAMPKGGLLTLESRNVSLNAEDVKDHLDARQGDFVRLTVSDTGHGMAPEIRNRIFEPFFTTKKPGEGTGLGLSMVFGIIQQHQGWIECHSEPDQGTSFVLYLPRHRDKGELIAPHQTDRFPAVNQPDHGTILVADDEEALRDLAAMILQEQGYKVIVAVDGQEAVEIFEREAHSIDLVLLDLTMPRLSGQDAFQRMLAIRPEAPVLFTSGFSKQHLPPADHERIQGFISKPFLPKELTRLVRAALERVRAAAVKQPGRIPPAAPPG